MKKIGNHTNDTSNTTVVTSLSSSLTALTNQPEWGENSLIHTGLADTSAPTTHATPSETTALIASSNLPRHNLFGDSRGLASSIAPRPVADMLPDDIDTRFNSGSAETEIIFTLQHQSHIRKMLNIIQQPTAFTRSDLESIITLAQELSLDEGDNKLLLAAQLLLHMQDLDDELDGNHIQGKSETQFSGLWNFSKNLALSFCALWLVFFLAGLLQFGLASSSSHKASAEQAYQAFFWSTVIIWGSYALTLLITTCVAICDGYRTKQTQIPYMQVADFAQLTTEDQDRWVEIFGDYVVTEISLPIATTLSTYIKTGQHGRFFDHGRVNQTQTTDDANFTQVEIVVSNPNAEPSERISENLSSHMLQQPM